MTELTEFWGEPIHTYSRQQALKDGVLIDVTEMAQEAGIHYPTAVTRRLWDEWIVPDEDSLAAGQDEKGRLWDVLWMSRLAILRGEEGSEVYFAVLFVVEGTKQVEVQLRSVCGPNDDMTPCITVMLPEED